MYVVASSENGSGAVSESTGVINLGVLNAKSRLRHYDLMAVGNAKYDLGMSSGKKSAVSHRQKT